MNQRTPYDGQPYYCGTCGLGYGEFLACEEHDCALESAAMNDTKPPLPLELETTVALAALVDLLADGAGAAQLNEFRSLFMRRIQWKLEEALIAHRAAATTGGSHDGT